QLADEIGADEAGSACDKAFHLFNSCSVRRKAVFGKQKSERKMQVAAHEDTKLGSCLNLCWLRRSNFATFNASLAKEYATTKSPRRPLSSYGQKSCFE